MKKLIQTTLIENFKRINYIPLFYILILLSFASFVVADSQVPTYYEHSDGVDTADTGLDNVTTGINGNSPTTTGWSVLGLQTSYSNVQKTLGSVSLLLNNDALGDNERIYFPFTNASYTGIVSYSMYLNDSYGSVERKLQFVGTTMDFGVTTNPNNFTCGGVITNKTILYNVWFNISITNLSEGRFVVWYSDATSGGWKSICNIASNLAGITDIRFLTISSGSARSMYIDEFKMTKQRTDIYWNNDGGGGAGTSTSAPTFTAPTPPDNAHNNTNQTINITHGTIQNDVLYSLYFGTSATLTENDLMFVNVTRDGNEWKSWMTNVSDGTYYYKAKVVNITNGVYSANTTQRTWILDTTTPTITLNPTNGFKSDNSTIISNYLSNLTLNITFFDSNLLQSLINITTNGVSVYSRHNSTMGGSMYDNLSTVVNLSTLATGNYTVYLAASDSHTLNEWKAKKISSGLDYFNIDTPENRQIKITSKTMPLSKSTAAKKDRLNFGFNYLFSQETYSYYIESDNPIIYLPESKATKSPHFIIMAEDGVHGNWIDFDEQDLSKADYQVIKISDTKYQIDVTSNGKNSFGFNSIGGLNVKEEYYSFKIASVIDVYARSIALNASLGFTSSLDGNSKSATATNGVRYENITNSIHTLIVNSTSYDSETLSFTPTEKYYNLTINMTSGILLDNCTIWSKKTLNVTFINATSMTLISVAGEAYIPYNKSSSLTWNYSNEFNGNSEDYCIKSTNSLLATPLFSYTVGSTQYTYTTVLTLTENVTYIPIYVLGGTTLVKFIVYDETGSPVKDAYIAIKYFDVGSGTYETTEIIKTDSDGFAWGNIVLFTTFYQFEITYNGAVIYTSETAKVSETTKTFRVSLGAGIVMPITKLDQLDIDLASNDNQLYFQVNWSSINATLSNISLEIYQTNNTANNLLFINSSNLTTGTMRYNLALPYNESTGLFVGNVYGISVDDGNKYFIKGVSLDLRQEYDVFGTESLLMVFLYTGTMISIGLYAGIEAGLVLGIFSLILFWMLGFYMLSLDALIAIIVCFLVILVKIRRGLYGA